MNLNLTDTNYSKEDIDSCTCVDFGKDTRFGGSYEKEEIVNYLELLLVPCKRLNPGDCRVDIGGVPTSTIDDTSLLSEYLKDYSLEILYVDSSHNVRDFEKPLTKNIQRKQL